MTATLEKKRPLERWTHRKIKVGGSPRFLFNDTRFDYRSNLVTFETISQNKIKSSSRQNTNETAETCQKANKTSTKINKCDGVLRIINTWSYSISIILLPTGFVELTGVNVLLFSCTHASAIFKNIFVQAFCFVRLY